MKKSLLKLTAIIPLVLLLCFAFSCQKQQIPKTTSAEEIKANVHQVIDEAWNKGNLDILDNLYDANMVYHAPPFPDIVGLEAYKQFIKDNRTSYPDLVFTIQELIVEGNTGAMLWTYTGTQEGGSPVLGIPPTGKHVIFKGCTFFHNVDGKTVEVWSYVGWLGLMKQLGFTFTPPQPPKPEEKK